MKSVAPLLAFLMMLAVSLPAQSLKKLERKARKTMKKEAYGMALYYSQAILKIDASHAQALQWSDRARDVLQLNQMPTDVAKEHAAAIPFNEEFVGNDLSGLKQGQKGSITFIVKTFNEMDSSALNNTYVGVTEDGFGEGRFVQNGESGNTAIFTLPSNEFFTITGTKNQFASGTSTLSTNDALNGDTLYADLYLSPSWGLPIALYFDHQKPNALSPADTTTNLTYEQAWADYLFQIDTYIDTNTISDSMIHKAKAQREVGRFFADRVDGNFQKLKPLCELIKDYLKAGNKISLVLESQVGPFEYDENAHALAARRMNTIENYFSFYENGIFQPWLASGDFKIKRNYLLNEKKINVNTIFDLNAAESRKVIIKMVEYMNQ